MNKNTILLLVVFVLLLGGVYFQKFMGKKKYETGESAQAAEALFAELDKDKVARLILNGPESGDVELVKEGEYWKVDSAGGYRADQSKIDGALDEIIGLKRGTVVSRKPDLEVYDLTGENAISVKALDAAGSTIAEFGVGKTVDYRSTFIKLPSESEIRKVESSLRSRFDVTGGWRDMTILAEGVEDDIEQLVIAGPVDRIVFSRQQESGPEEPAVEGADPEAADAANEVYWDQTHPKVGRCTKWQCDSMARALTDLDADSFFDGSQSLAELGLDPPAYTLTAERAEDKKTVLFMGTKIDGKFPVKLPDQDTIWWMPGYRGDYFTKKPEDYLQEKPQAEEENTEDGVNLPLDSLPEAVKEAVEQAEDGATTLLEETSDKLNETGQAIDETLQSAKEKVEAVTGDGKSGGSDGTGDDGS